MQKPCHHLVYFSTILIIVSNFSLWEWVPIVPMYLSIEHIVQQFHFFHNEICVNCGNICKKSAEIILSCVVWVSLSSVTYRVPTIFTCTNKKRLKLFVEFIRCIQQKIYIKFTLRHKYPNEIGMRMAIEMKTSLFWRFGWRNEAEKKGANRNRRISASRIHYHFLSHFVFRVWPGYFVFFFYSMALILDVLLTNIITLMPNRLFELFQIKCIFLPM